MTKGWFITLEGGEGSGKTTQAQLIKDYLEEQGFDVILTREPGGVKIAEQIRNILIGPDVKDMDAVTEVFLYAAARREHYIEVILPALEAGKVVISDRFFDSSIVYQGRVKRGMDWRNILSINRNATKGKEPDLTLYFDIDPLLALKRIKQNENREVNRFDNADISFHYAVKNGYEFVLSNFPKRIQKINANQSPDRVLEDCLFYIGEKLGIDKKEPESIFSTLSFNEADLKQMVLAPPPPPTFTFQGYNGKEILKFTPDGEAYWKGRKIEADKELVEAMREFLSQVR